MALVQQVNIAAVSTIVLRALHFAILLGIYLPHEGKLCLLG